MTHSRSITPRRRAWAGPIGLVLAGIPGAADAGVAQPAEAAPWAVQLGASVQQDLLPPFWSEPRDRWTVEAAGHWRVAPAVTLWLQLDALRHDGATVTADPRTGAGDLRLGTDLRLWSGAVEGRAGWWVKLPNADDELELGTDETDIGGLLGLVLRPGPLRLQLDGGAEVRGDPARSRTQDPVALLQAEARTDLGLLEPSLRARAELPTERQPTRAEVGLSLERRCPLLVGVGGALGLAEASPAWTARLWLGYSGSCTTPANPATPSEEP